MRIIHPRQNRTKHISEVTKTQLAHTVNEQSQTIQRLDVQVRLLGKMLIAITQQPEAFRFTDKVTIDGAALAQVKPRTDLMVDTASDGTVTLTTRRKGQQLIDTPTVDVGGAH